MHPHFHCFETFFPSHACTERSAPLHYRLPTHKQFLHCLLSPFCLISGQHAIGERFAVSDGRELEEESGDLGWKRAGVIVSGHNLGIRWSQTDACGEDLWVIPSLSCPMSHVRTRPTGANVPQAGLPYLHRRSGIRQGHGAESLLDRHRRLASAREDAPQCSEPASPSVAVPIVSPLDTQRGPSRTGGGIATRVMRAFFFQRIRHLLSGAVSAGCFSEGSKAVVSETKGPCRQQY
jgi:hypothetical protein